MRLDYATKVAKEQKLGRELGMGLRKELMGKKMAFSHFHDTHFQSSVTKHNNSRVDIPQVLSV